MSIGGQPGNQNAASKRIWQAAINRALEKRGSGRIEALDALAEKLLTLADAGDLGALKELGDRLEGKSVQQTEVTGKDGGAIVMQVEQSDTNVL